MKACAEFENCRDASIDFDLATIRGQCPRDNFQQRRLSGTISTNDANNFTATDLHVDIRERGETLMARAKPNEFEQHLRW